MFNLLNVISNLIIINFIIVNVMKDCLLDIMNKNCEKKE